MSTPPAPPRPDDGDGETLCIGKLLFHPGPLDPRWGGFPPVSWGPTTDEPPTPAPPADEEQHEGA